MITSTALTSYRGEPVTFRIAVAGKGGTGKTTFSTLMVRFLAEKGKTPILAIDADPNSCLGTMLGTPQCQTIGDLHHELEIRIMAVDQLGRGLESLPNSEGRGRKAEGAAKTEA